MLEAGIKEPFTYIFPPLPADHRPEIEAVDEFIPDGRTN